MIFLAPIPAPLRALLPVLWLCLSVIPAAAEVPLLDRNRAEAHCREKWTKRGQLDSNMFAYCMKRQKDGYEEARSLYARYATLKDIDAISDYAAGKWLRAREYQFEMVAYEMERQIDAFLNIAYDLKAGKYSDDQIFRCVAKWYSDAEPQWDMVEYCLRR